MNNCPDCPICGKRHNKYPHKCVCEARFVFSHMVIRWYSTDISMMKRLSPECIPGLELWEKMCAYLKERGWVEI